LQKGKIEDRLSNRGAVARLFKSGIAQCQKSAMNMQERVTGIEILIEGDHQFRGAMRVFQGEGVGHGSLLCLQRVFRQLKRAAARPRQAA